MHRNEVVLAGRLPDAPDEKVLPSGDRVVTWRVIVQRPPGGAPGTRVDSIPCVTFDPKLHELVGGWRREDFVEVTGVIRRRFWRTPQGGSGSRIEVEAHTVRKIEPPTPLPAPPATPAKPRTLRSLLNPEPTPDDAPTHNAQHPEPHEVTT
jgi:single-stranded DNA-binding protein